MRSERTVWAVAALAGAALAGAAPAAVVIPLAGGWEAIVNDPNVLDVAVDFASIQDDILVIEKFAQFVDIDPFTGRPAPLNITFRQTAADAQTVSRIVITDEAVFNSTGQAWNGFDMILMGARAHWNPLASADFSYEPFTSMVFSEDLKTVSFSGGSIADGGFWFPGVVAGGLVIDVDLSGAAPAIFVLKEIPTVPASGSLPLLGVAALLAVRRRRRDG
ncbi:MAG: hypothetical protein KF817_13035 [Phycisphaeraceae bacterium]|nr:hypothetical protein [Phycisphaeraceae bacterium]